jgi:hypothetical protein
MVSVHSPLLRYEYPARTAAAVAFISTTYSSTNRRCLSVSGLSGSPLVVLAVFGMAEA